MGSDRCRWPFSLLQWQGVAHRTFRVTAASMWRAMGQSMGGLTQDLRS